MVIPGYNLCFFLSASCLPHIPAAMMFCLTMAINEAKKYELKPLNL
jgi:hypothetical protein